MPQRVRHPPVARVDMATVGTSMSDGQCHEAGHQVWCKKLRHAKNPLVVVLEMDFFCWFPFAKRLLVDTFFMGGRGDRGDRRDGSRRSYQESGRSYQQDWEQKINRTL